MATPIPRFAIGQDVRLMETHRDHKAGDGGRVVGLWATAPGNPYYYTYAVKFDKDGLLEMGVPETKLKIA
ncbi:hypothetical protein CPB85DRAFT_1442145 [Mucidula mucida]|nr:hypothetical protein CPB85DRAFT_1442145 [Mucidula mucida]